MTRSMLAYPLNRSIDTDAGGVADLQTDVMRFMAILALCLVAIFALVQSIPLRPEQAKPTSPPKTSIPKPTAIIETVRKELIDFVEPVPNPIPVPVPVEQIVTLPERPVATERIRTPEPVLTEEPSAEATVQLPDLAQLSPAPPQPASTPRGFTLRFESDLALTRLVARNEVGLYAMADKNSLRMNVNRGRISFWRASAPNQFHEMDGVTVPDNVVAAAKRSGLAGVSSQITWGVTLPTKMRKQLDKYLSEYDSGSLIISADGSLQLEPDNG